MKCRFSHDHRRVEGFRAKIRATRAKISEAGGVAGTSCKYDACRSAACTYHDVPAAPAPVTAHAAPVSTEFEHGYDAAAPHPVPTAALVAAPTPCAFEVRGVCRHGLKCKFSHVDDIIKQIRAKIRAQHMATHVLNRVINTSCKNGGGCKNPHCSYHQVPSIS
jgi:Zinc finger C-x8-C-x5-C-x3-H type (and similar)